MDFTGLERNFTNFRGRLYRVGQNLTGFGSSFGIFFTFHRKPVPDEIPKELVLGYSRQGPIAVRVKIVEFKWNGSSVRVQPGEPSSKVGCGNLVGNKWELTGNVGIPTRGEKF